MSEAQLDIAIQEIYFCRYLSIAPTDFDMGANVKLKFLCRAQLQYRLIKDDGAA